MSGADGDAGKVVEMVTILLPPASQLEQGGN
jgi:hypothetical protein